jgi:hypothetical protein
MIIALAIQALAFAVFLYRHRKQGLSPDGVFYLAMGHGHRVPRPYTRRWLLPLVLGDRGNAWSIASGAAFLAVGPLIYALTGSLACVWFCAWLPGLAVNVRFPVLTDQVAFALMLAAVVAHRAGLWWVALPLMFLAGQCKEVAPMFGAVLCWDPWIGAAAGASVACALVVGKVRSVPGTEPYMLHPFRVALTKHDPLSWVSMVLPWGGVAMVGMAMGAGLELNQAVAVAMVSLAMGYGQLLLANDEARLFVWAAPAVLCVVGGYEGAWLVPALCAHPWLCGAAKRV